MGETVLVLAITTDFLGAMLSLWLALYFLGRSYGNRLVYRVVLILLALSLYYFVGYSSFWITVPAGVNISGTSVVVLLLALHSLTQKLLHERAQRQLDVVSKFFFGFGIVSIGIILGVPAMATSPTIRILHPQSPILWVPAVFDGLISFAIAYNLWRIRKDGTFALNRSFYAVIVMGVATVLYGMVETLFRFGLPRFVATIFILAALMLLGYSVTRYQALIIRRTAGNDFILTAIVNFILAALFIALARGLGLGTYATSLFGLLAVVTHAIFDLFRGYLDVRSQQREAALRSRIRTMARHEGEGMSFDTVLRRSLAILCHNLEASSGLVALEDFGQLVLRASFNAAPVGTTIPGHGLLLENASPVEGGNPEGMAWIAPVFAEDGQVGVVGIGPRLGLKEYTDEDIDWLDEISEKIGIMYQKKKRTGAGQQEDSAGEQSNPSAAGSAEINDLFSTLALKPNREIVKVVEDGFRRFQDYSSLGNSALIELFEVSGETHLERGRRVQQKLLETLELLHPGGKRPSEPIPREWHPYVVLYDAYVNDVSTREIMARLYISEGTYYRTRRKALRGVARAILERRMVNV